MIPSEVIVRAFFFTVKLPISQNGQTYSNKSLAVADELFELLDRFVGLTLEGLRLY